MAQKIFENGKCAKIEQMLSDPSADWQSEGFFNCLFLVLYFLLRGDTLRSNNSERINFFFLVGGGGGVDFPKNK